MKHNKIKLAVAIALIIIPVCSGLMVAQPASTAVPFLLISPNSRASAMGESGVSVADDASAAFWNPAGLGFQKGQEISLTYSKWLPQFQQADLYYAFGAYRYNIPEIAGTVSGSFTFLNLGEFVRTSSDARELGTFRSYEFALALSYGTEITRDLGLGGGLRVIHSALSPVATEQEIGSGKATTIGVDIGVIYRPSRFVIPFTSTDIGNQIAFGASLTNFGPPIFYVDEAQSDPIPTNLRLGFAADFVKSEFNQFTWTLDVNKLLISRTNLKADDPFTAIGKTWTTKANGDSKAFSDVIKEFTFGTGFEYWYSKIIALRAGYFYEDPGMGNRNFLTFGAGVRYDIYGFDFSYISDLSDEKSPLAETLRFTLQVNWDRGVPDDSQRNPADDSSN